MAPIKVEICGNTIIANNDEFGGRRVLNTDLAFVYTGTKDGGRVVFGRKTDSSEYKYEKPIIVHQGENPIIKEIECRSSDKQEKTIVTKITAI